MRVVIIEDEELSAMKLKGYLEALEKEITVLATLGSVKESITYLCEQGSPDLIFLDVKLTDGDSFEIFRKVSTQAFIIFVTAYDQHALQAFDHRTISYLLKPFDQSDVAGALEKYQLFSGKGEGVRQDRIVAKKGNRSYTFSVDEVAYFEKDSVLFLVTRGGEKYLMDTSLERLEKNLDSKLFFRISRSCLVQYDCIESFASDSSHRYRVKLKELEGEFIVSQSRAADFRRWVRMKG